jgi:hypothetical protein
MASGMLDEVAEWALLLRAKREQAADQSQSA